MRIYKFFRSLLVALVLAGTTASVPVLTGCKGKSEDEAEKQGHELLSGDKPEIPSVLDGFEFGMSRDDFYEKFPDFEDKSSIRVDGFERTKIWARDYSDNIDGIDIDFKTDDDVLADLTERWGEPKMAEMMGDETPYWVNAEAGIVAKLHKNPKKNWSISLEGFVPITEIVGDSVAPPAAYGDLPLSGTRDDIDAKYPEFKGKDGYEVKLPGSTNGIEYKFDFKFMSDDPKPIGAFVVGLGYNRLDDPLVDLTAKWGEPEKTDGDNDIRYNWVNADTGVRAQLVTAKDGEARELRFENFKSLGDLFPEKPGVPAAFGDITFGSDRAAIDKAFPELAEEGPMALDFEADGYNGISFRMQTDYTHKDVDGFTLSFGMGFDQDPLPSMTAKWGEPTKAKDSFTKEETYTWFNTDDAIRAVYKPSDYSSTLTISRYVTLDKLVDLKTGKFFDGTEVPVGVSNAVAVQKLKAFKAEDSGYSVSVRIPATPGTSSNSNTLTSQGGNGKVVKAWQFGFGYGSEDKELGDKMIAQLTKTYGAPEKVAPKWGEGTIYRFGSGDFVGDLKVDKTSLTYTVGSPDY